MSKKSRGFRAGSQPSGATGAGPERPGSRVAADQPTTPAAPSRPATGSARATPTSRSAARRSSRATPVRRQTGLARYRNVLLIGAAVVGIGVVLLALFAGASAARYECETLLTPAPAPTAQGAAGPVASPDATPLLGFATRDLGRDHVPTGSTTRFAFCPPTSGDHWNVAGRAPLPRQVYGPGDDVSPGNWVHNLEHGYVVIAYRDELSPEEEAGIGEVFETANQGPVAAQCNLPNKVLAVPFDDISEPFALLAWDRVLLMSEWDTETALAFANQWQESPQHPEPSC